MQHHITADCPTHPKWVPLALKGHARGILRYLQVEGTVYPGALAHEHRRGRVVMRRASERNEKFIAIEYVATIHLACRGPKAPPAHYQGFVRLAQFDWFTVWLPIEDASGDYLVELAGTQGLVPSPCLLGHRQGISNLAHHQHRQTVHVKGKGCGGIALSDVLCDQTVSLESCAQAPVLLWHTEGKQPCRTQVIVVSERKRGLTVVLGRTRHKVINGQAVGEVNDLLLAGRRAKIHAV